jgi:hypothetical protein
MEGERANADALSRLPLQTNCTEENPVCVRAVYKDAPMSFKSIKESTDLDENFWKLRDMLSRAGLSVESAVAMFNPFFAVRNELSLIDNCMLKGQRIVIPRAIRGKILDLLHQVMWE